MLARLALPLLLLVITPALSLGQTVRFYTNVGSFDMLLNPTGIDDLNGHVENMLQYIESGRYVGTTINRAPDNFVLQMGSFLTDAITDIDSTDQYNPIEQFDDLIVDEDGDGQVDFDISDLPNLRGTVSLALAGGNPNTGASSFFVNIADNNFLDPQGFIPFATITDMTVVDQIMALSRISLDSSLTFVDVPVREDGSLVIITGTEVIDDTPAGLGPIGPSASTAAFEALMAAGASGSSSGGSAAANAGVPEPSSALLAAGAITLLAARVRRRS